MNPWMLAMTAASPLLGMLFRDKSAERNLKLFQQFANPQKLAEFTNTIFKSSLQSPAFSAAQNNVLGGANQAQSAIAQRVSGSGLTSTGIGNLSLGAGSALAGFGMADLNQQFYGQSQQRAMELISQILSGGSMAPSRNVGADLTGNALQTLAMALMFGQKSGWGGGGSGGGSGGWPMPVGGTPSTSGWKA